MASPDIYRTFTKGILCSQLLKTLLFQGHASCSRSTQLCFTGLKSSEGAKVTLWGEKDRKAEAERSTACRCLFWFIGGGPSSSGAGREITAGKANSPPRLGKCQASVSQERGEEAWPLSHEHIVVVGRAKVVRVRPAPAGPWGPKRVKPGPWRNGTRGESAGEPGRGVKNRIPKS